MSMGAFNRAVCSSAEVQSTSTKCLSSQKMKPRREWGRALTMSSCDAVIEHKSKNTGYCPAGQGSLITGRCFSRDMVHSMQVKGVLVLAAAFAAACEKVRPGWALDDEAMAFSAIVLLVQKNFCYTLMLVRKLITIGEQGE